MYLLQGQCRSFTYSRYTELCFMSKGSLNTDALVKTVLGDSFKIYSTPIIGKLK